VQETLKKIRREELSIALIWLFHVSGIIGIVYGDALWFIQATPINLSLSFALAIYNGWSSKHFVKLGILAFSAGMIAEILGVNFGWIFGDYAYGEMLGWKFLGVPWLIGANWVILVVCTGQIARDLVSSKIGQILVGVGLMVFLDLLIEPMAPRLDFWEFEGGQAPIQNYIGWALVALPLQIFMHGYNVRPKGYFFHHLYLLQILFFTVLLLKLNSITPFAAMS
jgi:putative membrane protein